MEAGTKVTAKGGAKGSVVSSKGGWIEVKIVGEKELKKFRMKDLTPVAKGAAAVTDDKLVPADLAKYTLHESKTANGRRHLDIADDTADKLREKTLDQTYTYAAKVLDEPESDLRKRYKALNVGMQRMNLGNRVRAAFRAAEAAGSDMKKAA